MNLDVLLQTPAGEYSSAYFEARFFDKNDKRILLENGGVTLNGRRMGRADGDYYQLSSNDDDAPFYFRFDSLYTFRISLNGTGNEYLCSVRSQQNPLNVYSLAVLGDSARISWIGDTTVDIRLKYTLSRIVNNTWESVSRSKTFVPPHSGSIRVPLEGYSDITLGSLETVVTGTIDSAFRSGSIESMVRLTP